MAERLHGGNCQISTFPKGDSDFAVKPFIISSYWFIIKQDI